MKTIEISNIGAIKHTKIEIPEDGGVVVLRGRNGTGKSTSLNAVQAILSGGIKLSVRDGEANGWVDGLGVHLTVGRAQRASGELEVHSLEGKYSIADLVDPKIIDPDAADSRRVRAILDMTRQKVDASTFWPVVDGQQQFEELVPAKAAAGDDPVRMAGAIKRELDAVAFRSERHAEEQRAKAAALMSLNAGIDLQAEHDEIALGQSYANAESERRRIIAARDAYDAAQRSRAAHQTALDAIPADVAGAEQALNVAEDAANAAMAEKQAEVATLLRLEKDLVRQLDECRARYVLVSGEVGLERAKLDSVEAKRAALKSATDHRASLLEAIARCDAVPQATSGAVDQATNYANARLAAITKGSLIREAIARDREAKRCLGSANESEKHAMRMREAGKGTDDILSGLVSRATDRLFVEVGRLRCITARGKTFFSELSAGERWAIGIDLAIDAVGAGGVFVCPQEAWEGQDDENRRLASDKLKAANVVMITAQAPGD